jgi:hypothetical protein
MIKVGHRANIPGALARIQTKPQLAQETRDRIARVLVTIDKEATRKLYESDTAALENVPEELGTPEEKQKWQIQLQLLRSIEPIIKQ